MYIYMFFNTFINVLPSSVRYCSDMSVVAYSEDLPSLSFSDESVVTSMLSGGFMDSSGMFTAEDVVDCKARLSSE